MNPQAGQIWRSTRAGIEPPERRYVIVARAEGVAFADLSEKRGGQMPVWAATTADWNTWVTTHQAELAP